MNKETIQISDTTCTIFKSEQPDCLLIQPIDEHDLEGLDNEVSTIQSLCDRPFTLVAFKVKDWQSDLTPWTAPAVFGKIPFGNGAASTLLLIVDQIMPELEHMQLLDRNKMQCLLGGYSLAGFFALWAGYQTQIFDGIAAVSPSVWYPKWIDYAATHKPLAKSVYLSLGDKEEKTKNAVMAQVGNCMRKQLELLTAQGISTTLEWNPGNHFQHADERTAKGWAWVMNGMR